MKILIIGEFSGLAKNLKIGLNYLGNQVSIVSTGDGFKNIEIEKDDILLYGQTTCRNRILHYLYKIKDKISKNRILSKNKFDCVILMNSHFIVRNIFSMSTGITMKTLNNVLNRDCKFILLACGYEPCYYDNIHMFRYAPYLETHRVSNSRRRIFNKIVQMADVIVPTGYVYLLGFDVLKNSKKFNFKISPIPLAYDVKSTDYKYEEKNNKIVIFHGINRLKEKGSDLIMDAMLKIKDKYKENVILKIPSKLAYADYIEEMKLSNIVIDQAYSYGLGMNALIGLSMGKIVLGGAEPESLDKFEIKNSPVVNILPNVQDIFDKLEKIILMTNEERRELSYASRDYAMKNHDSVKIANEYITLINKYI